MENSTLQNLSFTELRSRSKNIGKLLYIVALAAMFSIFAMPFVILSTQGVGVLNLVLGALAIGLTVYLYRLSIRDSKMHQEMWKRKFRS